MVSPDTTAEPEAPMDVDPFSGATWCIDPPSRGSTPVAEWAVCRQISEVRTVCVRSASTDLCGGCRVTGIPTATQPAGRPATPPCRCFFDPVTPRYFVPEIVRVIELCAMFRLRLAAMRGSLVGVPSGSGHWR